MSSTAGGLVQPASGLSLGVLVPVLSPCLLLLGYLFDFYFDKVNHRKKKKGNISLLPCSGPEQISTGTRKNGSPFSHKYGQTQIHLWGPVRSTGRNMIKHKTRSFRKTVNWRHQNECPPFLTLYDTEFQYEMGENWGKSLNLFSPDFSL